MTDILSRWCRLGKRLKKERETLSRLCDRVEMLQSGPDLLAERVKGTTAGDVAHKIVILKEHIKEVLQRIATIKEEFDALSLIIDGLPPTQKTVLVLKYMEGYRDWEIARMMGIRPHRVKVIEKAAKSIIATIAKRED